MLLHTPNVGTDTGTETCRYREPITVVSVPVPTDFGTDPPQMTSFMKISFK